MRGLPLALALILTLALPLQTRAAFNQDPGGGCLHRA